LDKNNLKMKSKILKLFIFIILIAIIAGGLVLLKNFPDILPDKINNVILISIDTCRADFLSCYGYPRKTTPNIDAIAKKGILFENVIAPVPMTFPSHTSMFTGTIPPAHGVHDNMLYKAEDSLLTLAEILKANGFSTAAVLAAEVLDSSFGLDQGFDDYYDPEVLSLEDVQRPGNEINQIGMGWLGKHKDERFFLFLHYFDPHFPYTPPEPFKSSFIRNPQADESSSEYVRDLYAGEVAFADHCISQIVNALKKLDLYDSTLIIITSDHGEMLYEHGELTHSYWIYQSAIKVPMIIKLPGRKKPKRIKKIAGIVDIVPTICSLLEIETPSNIQGRDLTTYFAEQPPESRYLYCESLTATKYQGNSLLGVVSDNYKYIQTTRPELYDIVNDPAETINLVTAKPQLAKILQDHLKRTLEDTPDSSSTANQAQFSRGIRDSLESLGYVASAMVEDYSFDQSKDDPKDLYACHHLSSLLTHLCSRNKYDQAREVCEKLISIRPEYYKPYFQLAVIEAEEGNYKNAIPYLEKAIKLDHTNYLLHKHLGLAFYEVGKPRLAFLRLTNSLKLNPLQPDVHEKLATIFYEKKQFDESIIHLKESLKLKPDQPDLLNKLASLYSRQGGQAQAIECLNKSLNLKPAQPDVISEMGFIYYRQQRLEPAVKQWSDALELDPNQKDALFSLAWIMATSKNENLYNPEQALVLAHRACELTDKKDPRILDTLAAALAANGNFIEAIEIVNTAISLAESVERKDLVEDFKDHLKLYENKQTYRE
jgi:arylsulfatase A-like enzyme/Flp pilus assembly protein TadD